MSMQQFGIGWLVVELAYREGAPERAAFYIGVIGFSAVVPGFVAGLLAGVVADRYDRRYILLAIHAVLTVLSTALGLLVVSDRASIPVVAALSALFAGTFAFDIPARQSVVPRLVPTEQFMSATGLNYAAIQGTQFIGPLIGGLLIGPLGLGGMLLVNAAMRLTIIAALLAMAPQPVGPDARRGRNVIASLLEGLGYARRDAVIWWLNVLFAVTAIGRMFQQFLPAVASEVLHAGPVQLSWMLGSAGLGSLVGSLITASLGGLQRRGLLFLVLLLVGSLLGVLFSLQRELVPMLLILPLSGAAAQLALALTVGSLQLRASNEYRGRVVGLHLMTVQLANPLGQLVLGSLGTAIGVSQAIGIVALWSAAIAAVALVRARSLRAYVMGETAPAPAR